MVTTDFLRRTWIEVDTNAIINNLAMVKKLSKKSVYAVVKADAYGHGATAVSTVLQKNGADGFAVSNIVEAVELRKAGITAPILILGYTPVELTCDLHKFNITQCVFSLDFATSLNNEAVKCGINIDVHLKLDTGMGRLGFDCRNNDLKGIENAKNVLGLTNLSVSGVFTHFAVADSILENDKQFTKEQYNRFIKAVNLLESNNHKFKIKHCGNSAGSLTLDMPETDVVRAGIILYGLTPDAEFPLPEGFKAAMSMYSVVSEVKTVSKGDTVNYGRTYKAQGPRKIATVSAGYADGVPRLLSNNGFVIINGNRAPIVGRVCMDQLCADVTDIPNVTEGDTVTIFGEGLPVEEIADEAQTINYEIICGISKRVPIVYINK